jgi:hypothetical protein
LRPLLARRSHVLRGHGFYFWMILDRSANAKGKLCRGGEQKGVWGDRGEEGGVRLRSGGGKRIIWELKCDEMLLVREG